MQRIPNGAFCRRRRRESAREREREREGEKERERKRERLSGWSVYAQPHLPSLIETWRGRRTGPRRTGEGSCAVQAPARHRVLEARPLRTSPFQER